MKINKTAENHLKNKENHENLTNLLEQDENYQNH